MQMQESTTNKKYVPTAKLAQTFGVKPDTVRRNLCTKGHFMGLKPIKLPNNRLLWPATTPEQFEV